MDTEATHSDKPWDREGESQIQKIPMNVVEWSGTEQMTVQSWGRSYTYREQDAKKIKSWYKKWYTVQKQY